MKIKKRKSTIEHQPQIIYSKIEKSNSKNRNAHNAKRQGNQSKRSQKKTKVPKENPKD